MDRRDDLIMGKRVFAICEPETEYAFRLMNYLNRKKTNSFDVRVFTSSETLIHFAEDREIEILLISESSMNPKICERAVKKLIVLSEEKMMAGESDYFGVYKYQASADLVREVMQEYGTGDRENPVWDHKAHVIGIYSPSCYAQQMFFGFALAQAIAEHSAAIYLNLEEFSGFETYLGKEYERNLGDLYYLLDHSGGESDQEKIMSCIYSIGQLDFIPPFRYVSDMREIGREDWEKLLELLTIQRGYETVIMDMGHLLPELEGLMEYCREIYLPSESGIISNIRNQAFLEQIKEEIFQERVHIVYPPLLELDQIQAEDVFGRIGRSSLGRYVAKLSGEERF
jgi:hypothetical protein